MASMKARSFMALLGCAALLIGCETTDTAQGGNQEAKRRAAMEKQKQQEPLDEANANLWSAQQNRLERDGNPSRSY
jgi:hypothetical protein